MAVKQNNKNITGVERVTVSLLGEVFYITHVGAGKVTKSSKSDRQSTY